MLIKKALETNSTRERAELLLADLEKLKEKVSSIETQYDILQTDFSKMCEDAIARLSEIKTDLDPLYAHEKPTVNVKSIITDGLNVLEPEINNLKARFKLGILPVDLKVKHQDILIEDVEPEPYDKGTVQFTIDKTAGGIEYVLDKLGDLLILPIVLVVNIWKAFRRLIRRR
jgi:hypothetical protein